MSVEYFGLLIYLNTEQYGYTKYPNSLYLFLIFKTNIDVVCIGF